VDYCGPFILKTRGRGNNKYKGYIVVFICFSTRSIHLEVTTDLSTANFISAFKRFISRRGKPTNMYSDQGTNLIGANNELQEVQDFLKKHTNQIKSELSSQGINFKFNSPHAPHMGGVWESAVKLVKTHLKKVMTSAIFTYEDFTTVIYQIEGILNSRPLAPVSEDPDDFGYLTPAHLLTGFNLQSLPEPDVLEIKLNHLDRFQLIERKRQEFWVKWSKEYLHTLQQRPKWVEEKKDFQVGDLTILMEDNVPPQEWRLARIKEIHPGLDGHVRNVTVETDGKYRKDGRKQIKKFIRPITKLCHLPYVYDDNETVQP